MARLINAEALSMAMYHEAMEKDSDFQRWDSGCWIRYKLFENVLDAQPTIDAVPVIRCADCLFWDRGPNQTEVSAINLCRVWKTGTFDQDFCSRGSRPEWLNAALKEKET